MTKLTHYISILPAENQQKSLALALQKIEQPGVGTPDAQLLKELRSYVDKAGPFYY